MFRSVACILIAAMGVYAQTFTPGQGELPFAGPLRSSYMSGGAGDKLISVVDLDGAFVKTVAFASDTITMTVQLVDNTATTVTIPIAAGGGGGLTDSQVQALVGAMVTGNTETGGVTLSYNTATEKIDATFVLVDDDVRAIVGGMVNGNTEVGGIDLEYDATTQKLNATITLPAFAGVATDATITGDGTTGSPLSAVRQPVVSDGTMTGTGLPADPLSVVPAATSPVTVSTDGATVTGDGSPTDPLVAPQQPVATDNTILGNGLPANPLRAVHQANASDRTLLGDGRQAHPFSVVPQPIATDATITGDGLVATPLSAVRQPVVSDGTLTGTGLPTSPLSVVPSATAPTTVSTDGTLAGDGSPADPLSVQAVATTVIEGAFVKEAAYDHINSNLLFTQQQADNSQTTTDPSRALLIAAQPGQRIPAASASTYGRVAYQDGVLFDTEREIAGTINQPGVYTWARYAGDPRPAGTTYRGVVYYATVGSGIANPHENDLIYQASDHTFYIFQSNRWVRTNPIQGYRTFAANRPAAQALVSAVNEIFYYPFNSDFNLWRLTAYTAPVHENVYDYHYIPLADQTIHGRLIPPAGTTGQVLKKTTDDDFDADWADDAVGGGGGGVAQVQADYTEADATAVSFILNKPTLPTFGTAATRDAGTAAGEVPILDANGEIPRIELPFASDTRAGITQYATNADASAGTNPRRSLTPGNLGTIFGLVINDATLNVGSPSSEPRTTTASRQAIAEAIVASSNSGVETSVPVSGSGSGADPVTIEPDAIQTEYYADGSVTEQKLNVDVRHQLSGVSDLLPDYTYGINQNANQVEVVFHDANWSQVYLAQDDIVLHRARWSLHIQPGTGDLGIIGRYGFVTRVNATDYQTVTNDYRYSRTRHPPNGNFPPNDGFSHPTTFSEGNAELEMIFDGGWEIPQGQHFQIGLHTNPVNPGFIHSDNTTEENPHLGHGNIIGHPITYVAQGRPQNDNATGNVYRNSTRSYHMQIDYQISGSARLSGRDENMSVYIGANDIDCVGAGITCSDRNGDVFQIEVPGATGGGAQADWDEEDVGSGSHILNKPILGTAARLDVGGAENEIPTLGPGGLVKEVDLPDASVTRKGIVRIATETEANDAANMDLVISPHEMARMFALFRLTLITDNPLDTANPPGESDQIAASRRVLAEAVADLAAMIGTGGGGGTSALVVDTLFYDPAFFGHMTGVNNANGTEDNPSREGYRTVNFATGKTLQPGRFMTISYEIDDGKHIVFDAFLTDDLIARPMTDANPSPNGTGISTDNAILIKGAFPEGSTAGFAHTTAFIRRHDADTIYISLGNRSRTWTGSGNSKLLVRTFSY